MSTPDGIDFRSPDSWDQNDAAFDAQLAPYRGQPLTEEANTQLFTIAFERIVELRVVAKTLALAQAQNQQKRASKPREPRERKPKALQNFLAVAGQETSEIIPLDSTVMSGAEAIALGQKLIAIGKLMVTNTVENGGIQE